MRELFQSLRHHATVAGVATAFDDGTTRLDYATLARRVAGAAEEIRSIAASPAVIGLLGGNRPDWIVGYLAGWHEGKAVVPLPPFFSASQLGHLIGDAGISHVLVTSDMAERARFLSVPFTVISDREATFTPPSASGGSVITYTSGSSGQPKGVLLRSEQVLWTARALAEIIQVRADDAYLSVLPLALLLETISAVVIPVLAGARVRLEPAFAATAGQADGGALAHLVDAYRPTCMALVPQLLARWLAHLSRTGSRAPDSLRFVAIGGAPVAPALAREAWEHGVPAHEGYGLSECGSVVSLNAPGERRAGTVGRPLSGVDVRIDDGEIVVRGPSVMERYLHGSPAEGVWRTGDVGEIDRDGYLAVRGRRDNLLVTPMGRNISPEWIESLVACDPRVADCLVALARGHVTAVLVPSEDGAEWFARASIDAIGDLIADRCDSVPGYAIPEQFVVLPPVEQAAADVATSNGRLRRTAVLELYLAALKLGMARSKAITQRHREQ
jgi:long-subunit acyl-CoA synthetase (AMP-forming)